MTSNASISTVLFSSVTGPYVFEHETKATKVKCQMCVMSKGMGDGTGWRAGAQGPDGGGEEEPRNDVPAL